MSGAGDATLLQSTCAMLPTATRTQRRSFYTNASQRPLVLLAQLMLLSPLLNLGHLVLLTQFVMLLMPLLGS